MAHGKCVLAFPSPCFHLYGNPGTSRGGLLRQEAQAELLVEAKDLKQYKAGDGAEQGATLDDAVARQVEGSRGGGGEKYQFRRLMPVKEPVVCHNCGGRLPGARKISEIR